MIDQDWKLSKKPLSEYKVITLPRGDEKSHLDFVPAFQQGRASYGKKKSTDELQKEAMAKLEAAESKAMKAEVFEDASEGQD